jgi:hypothetical protein
MRGGSTGSITKYSATWSSTFNSYKWTHRELLHCKTGVDRVKQSHKTSSFRLAAFRAIEAQRVSLTPLEYLQRVAPQFAFWSKRFVSATFWQMNFVVVNCGQDEFCRRSAHTHKVCKHRVQFILFNISARILQHCFQSAFFKVHVSRSHFTLLSQPAMVPNWVKLLAVRPYDGVYV